jgi:glutaredoxin-like protein NrdH
MSQGVFHTQKETNMDRPRVKLYALTTCSHCKNTKKLLDENNVEYDCLEVDLTQGDEREAAIDEVKKYNPSCTFPTLIIGEKVIVGYRENEIKEALGL